MEPYERKDDQVLIQLNQRFTDFLDRYDRDWAHTQTWRQHHDDVLSVHGRKLDELKPLTQYIEFLAELRPNYKRAIVLLGLVITGSVGVAIKSFWTHVGWK